MIDCDVQRVIETNQDTTEPVSHGMSANVMGRLLSNHVAKKDNLVRHFDLEGRHQSQN